MTEAEKRLLVALSGMCQQYLSSDKGVLDHMWMGAGEQAIELLVQYGLVEVEGRGATWTEAGLKLLKSGTI